MRFLWKSVVLTLKLKLQRKRKMKGELYKIGDKVVHDVFGNGVIVDKIYSRYTKKLIIVVKFDSLNTNRNIVASFYGIRRKYNELRKVV